VYYEACAEVAPDSELLVWYGDGYLPLVHVPLTPEAARADHLSDEESKYACRRSYAYIGVTY